MIEEQQQQQQGPKPVAKSEQESVREEVLDEKEVQLQESDSQPFDESDVVEKEIMPLLEKAHEICDKHRLSHLFHVVSSGGGNKSNGVHASAGYGSVRTPFGLKLAISALRDGPEALVKMVLDKVVSSAMGERSLDGLLGLVISMARGGNSKKAGGPFSGYKKVRLDPTKIYPDDLKESANGPYLNELLAFQDKYGYLVVKHEHNDCVHLWAPVSDELGTVAPDMMRDQKSARYWATKAEYLVELRPEDLPYKAGDRVVLVDPDYTSPRHLQGLDIQEKQGYLIVERIDEDLDVFLHVGDEGCAVARPYRLVPYQAPIADADSAEPAAAA